jgi:hypothetical protein
MPNSISKAPWLRLRRFPLPGGIRWGITLALGLLVLAPAYLAWQAYLSPTTRSVQVPAWGWVHWGEWDYSVFLRPNTVYGTDVLGPGHTYYDTLIEGIEARLSYNVATDSPTRVLGWYEVTSTLSVGELPEERILVVPRSEFSEDETSHAGFTLSLPVDRQAYRNRVEEILAETGVQTRVNATVTYVAHIETTISGLGETHQTLEPTLRVPLNQESFTIGGNRALQDNGLIFRSEVQPVPGVVEQRRTWPMVAVAMALLPLVFWAATTTGAALDDPLTRKARQLYRKHRKRIAQAGPGTGALPGGEVVAVAAMDDLARVSEELLKPIIYANSEARGGTHLFYILDGTTRYEYRLELEPLQETPAR